MTSRSCLGKEPVFFDCEASALEGVPIEIGWAFLDAATGDIVSEAHLIKPPADWDLDALWDPEAEKLHGIKRYQLRFDGKLVWEVARRMNEALDSRELFADAPQDEAWLMQLFDAAGVEPTFVIRRMDARMRIMKEAADRNATMKVGELGAIEAEARKLSPRRHRAEADARYLAMFWKLATARA